MIDIAIIDSGLGGISLFSRLINTFSFKNYLYFADNKNLPYGKKSKKELLKITVCNLNKIIKKYNPKIVVFGCNTIGTTIIDEIKQKFKNNNIFAINPTFINKEKKLSNKKTLLLATNSTVKYLQKTNIIYYKNIMLCKMPLLANKIENYIKNLNNLVPYLKLRLQKFSDIKRIILGCTHYYFIKKQLSDNFPKTQIIDGGDFLIEQIKLFVCKNLNLVLRNEKSNKINVKLILTRKNKQQYKTYKNLIKNQL